MMNRQIAIVTVLVSAFAAAAIAYNYDDPVFNQILAYQLEDLAHESSYSPRRNRRDEAAAVNQAGDKCKKRIKKMCCAEETMEEQHEKHKDIKRECFKEITGKDKDQQREFDPFRCDKVDKHRKEMTCIMQCAGQKKNTLDKDGNPKEEEFAAHVKESMAKETWFAAIQDKVIQTCLSEARNATANREADGCNPAGVKLVHCMFREIQLGCPADQIKDEKACSRTKERIMKKQDFYLPPPSDVMNDE